MSLNVGRGGADISSMQRPGTCQSFCPLPVQSGMAASDHGLLLNSAPSANPRRYEGHWLRRVDQGWVTPRTSTDVFADLHPAEGYELRLSLEGQPDIELAL